jgi:hypothetical protein
MSLNPSSRSLPPSRLRRVRPRAGAEGERGAGEPEPGRDGHATTATGAATTTQQRLGPTTSSSSSSSGEAAGSQARHGDPKARRDRQRDRGQEATKRHWAAACVACRLRKRKVSECECYAADTYAADTTLCYAWVRPRLGSTANRRLAHRSRPHDARCSATQVSMPPNPRPPSCRIPPAVTGCRRVAFSACACRGSTNALSDPCQSVRCARPARRCSRARAARRARTSTRARSARPRGGCLATRCVSFGRALRLVETRRANGAGKPGAEKLQSA